MTHIIEQQPPSTNHLIVKRPIQRGDRVIFQWDVTTAPAGPVESQEHEVTITNAQTEPGLMKGWCVISWDSVDKLANKPKLNITIP